jgi:transposase
MTKAREKLAKGKRIDVGIDVHKKTWSVCVLCEGEEIYNAVLPADADRLVALLKRFGASEVHTVYEAGPTGFALHDALTAQGFDSMVTPPSLVPQTGGRVKTDRRDGRKLATLLATGFLRRVHVLSPQERAERQLSRTRNQIERHRCQVMNQIKSLLLLHNLNAPTGLREHWREAHLQWLRTVPCEFAEIRVALDALLALYDHVDSQVREFNGRLEELAHSDTYRDRVRVLTEIRGIGVLTAMVILLELQDVERFRRADQLSSYLGLTPVQHSSGESVRLGRITHCGNATVRTRLVQSAWVQIRFDPEARATFDRIKASTGSGKKAITAIARRLGLRVRRALLDMAPPAPAVASVPRGEGEPASRRVKRYILKRRQQL